MGMSPRLRVIVVDDEKISRKITVRELCEAGYEAEAAENAYQGLELLEQSPWDVVVTDLRMPSMDGLEFLREIQRQGLGVDVILMTAYGSIESAVAAMQEGAEDYLLKPFDFKELDFRLKRIEEKRATHRELSGLRAVLDRADSCCGLVGSSPPMRKVYELVKLFADNTAPVCITGETGTGKEVVSRAIHQLSGRSAGPFVPVGCSAIPREIAESEIFGHEQGAFTGAIKRRKGSFERAHGGTLLLDDIDDLSLEIQPKLLRALQEGTILRVGGEREISVDVRLIATTKVDLGEAVRQGAFREDLFYRINGLEIHLPPLRERGDDVLLVAQHFLRLLSSDLAEEVKTLDQEAMDALRHYHWPGNVRELWRVIETATALCQDSIIAPENLPTYVRNWAPETRPFSLVLGGVEQIDLNELINDFEREVMNWAMKKSGGEQREAAKLLGLPRSTLQSKLARKRDS